jgi:hypothetical protein
MVFREQRISRMESKGITLVDSWKTYVLELLMSALQVKLVNLTAGAGKSTLL